MNTELRLVHRGNKHVSPMVAEHQRHSMQGLEERQVCWVKISIVRHQKGKVDRWQLAGINSHHKSPDETPGRGVGLEQKHGTSHNLLQEIRDKN
jgi:hypothetical protein